MEFIKRIPRRRVGWLYDETTFNLKDPSSRIKNFISQNMNFLGWDSFLVYSKTFSNHDLDNLDALVICSIDIPTLKIIEECKKRSIVVLFHHMECIFTLPLQKEVFKKCDAIVCVSAQLAHETEAVNGMGLAFHIDDPADDIFFEKEMKETVPNLTVTYAGGDRGVGLYYADTISNMGWHFHNMTYPHDGVRDYFREEDDYGGNPYWWLDTYRSYHVSLCHQDPVCGRFKSHIKIVTAFANGLIPVARGIPSYRSVISHGENGFIFRDLEELKKILQILKDDSYRNYVRQNAIKTGENFTSMKIASKWMHLIHSMCIRKMEVRENPHIFGYEE